MAGKKKSRHSSYCGQQPSAGAQSWHGVRSIGPIHAVDFHPSLNALALLHTCRRVNEEIGDRWLRQVFFNFEDPETMLEKLSALSERLISQVRHVRVRGDAIGFSWPVTDDDVDYPLSHCLKLLPGLKLDTLTVLSSMDTNDSEENYDTLNRLIRLSGGWKELRFVCSSSTLLGYADTYSTSPFSFSMSEEELDIYLRKPQPACWQSILERRDGTDSHPSVVIYRSKIPGGKSSLKASLMADPSNWEPFNQEDTMGDGSYGLTEDATIMTTAAERDKGVLVIAQRGKGVDYQEKRNSPYIDGDIRRDAPGQSWKEIRKGCIDSLDDDSSDDEDDQLPTILESYKRVDEYEWIPRLSVWKTGVRVDASEL